MKIQEFRNLISTADRALLEKAFAESYKHFNKSQKEEVDALIGAILEGKDTKTAAKAAVNFGELGAQIEKFVDNAYAQNYLAPNREVPKSARSKWRFLVKDFLKALDKVALESPDYPRSVELRTELYDVLCEGCNVYLFSTDDPFRSVGWKQEELFQVVVKRTFALGYTRENVAAMLERATGGGLSRECLHVEKMLVLLGELKTSDVRYLALEEAKKLVTKKKAEFMKGKGDSTSRYYQNEHISNLCEMVLMIAVALAEPDEGVPYFFENCRESDPEVALYRALYVMDWMEEDQMWIDIYKYGISRKIRPRKELVKEYQERVKKKG
ncbi:MAG: hypothetical protein Q4F41_06680 [Eubacteriales bacterium]|nr:hypothetical protein [Eubacteriales bacterium]